MTPEAHAEYIIFIAHIDAVTGVICVWLLHLVRDFVLHCFIFCIVVLIHLFIFLIFCPTTLTVTFCSSKPNAAGAFEIKIGRAPRWFSMSRDKEKDEQMDQDQDAKNKLAQTIIMDKMQQPNRKNIRYNVIIYYECRIFGVISVWLLHLVHDFVLDRFYCFVS